MKNKTLWPLSLLILLGIIWGSGYTLARYATTHGVPPLGYSFWQSVGPAIALLLMTLIKEKRIPISGRHLRYYLIAGILGIALPNTNMYFAAPHLPAGILAVIVNTVPLMMYPLALIVGQEKFQWPRLFAVVVGVLGIMMIIGFKWNVPGTNNWELISLLTPLFFAMCALYSVYDRPVGSSSLSLATGMLVASAIVLTPLLVDMHEFYPLNSLSLQNFAVILEIILSSIGYVILFQLLKIAGAVYYSLVGGIVALTGLFWGWLLLGETISWWTVVAVVLIIIAVTVVTLIPAKEKS
ncbi:MAG: DMT family transporter [Gammaproteobacteria bacterium]|nr:DMT family transporter [Gammaproteobacteria bacterium]